MTKAGDRTALRGFDSYRVTLGDEMRGLRATLGKSLLDVQRDLRIKAAHLAALENADPSAVPHRGYLKGYLRAYARYLGMDEDDVMRRFREESGEELATAAVAAPRGPSKPGAQRPRDDLDAAIAGSRLAAASRAATYSGDLGATMRSLGSLAALIALVWGLGYGGWAVLQNIQRVNFAPQTRAPEALAQAPDFTSIARIAEARAAAPPVDAEALAAVYAAQTEPPVAPRRRDGPISDIDPARAGVYAAAPRAERAPRSPLPARDGLAEAAASISSPAEENLAAVAVTAPEPGPQAPSPAATSHVGAATLSLVFAEDAWVRIRDGGGRVLHEALMRAGAVWAAPEDAEGLTLRAGNAGGVFVEIGSTLYGPVGARGEVVSDIVIEADAIRETLPKADAIDALVEATLTSSLAEAEVQAR